MIGEVRDWEFGSPPCGWVFAIDVDPAARQQGVGTRCCGDAKRASRVPACACCARCWRATTPLILSFFRSQGMMAGPLIPLEMRTAGVAAAR
jgi:hypothetical protein